VGDIGAGKTTLARKMLDSLPDTEFEAALLVIIHSSISAQWLLRRIAQQLGVQKPADEKLQVLSQLYRRLLQIHESGKKAVVLIDEAQMLQTKEIMEEFRGLLNLEVPERKLITFVLFGLPDIEERLRLDPPLQQRVALKYRLDAFDAESTAKYVGHRLALSGAKREIFDSAAVNAIYIYSRGIPRLINTLADNALFEGFILKAESIRQEIVDNIAVDLGLSVAPKTELRLVEGGEPIAVVEDVSFSNPLTEEVIVSEVEFGVEKLSEQPFERPETGDNDDIDSILEGLDEKL
jgi:type II secretory pathway predicted ATPase ExeA